MQPIGPNEWKTVRGMQLRRDPAREECFEIAHLHSEMHDYGDMSPVARRERLHRHAHNEVQSLEIAAQCLADFPEAAWELRLQLARQCWDETRHAAVLYRRLSEIGGFKGEFPVMNYEWGVTCALDSLEARLALQNRTFEGGEMDLLRELAETWRRAGDPKTADVLLTILADEIQHVRFANQWLKRAAKENPRSLLKVATAIRFLQSVTAAFAPKPGEKSAVGLDLTGYTRSELFANVEDRRIAEFSEEEIEEIVSQERIG
jgi:uncharacterized ferritin-like protein (DUF455 family)